MELIPVYYLMILLYTVPSPTTSVIKRWIQNTNYENPKNWNIGRLPCVNDVISFAENSPPVFIQHNITTARMELPMNGEIIIGNGAFIAASAPIANSGASASGSKEACTGQQVKFNRTEPLEWLDPQNWHEGDLENEMPPPRLDTERVPCIYDDTIFPLNSTFLVSLDSKVNVKSLQILGITYSSDSLKQYLTTDSGQKQFKFTNDAEVVIEAQPCEDFTGCACGNDKGMIMHRICELQKSKCLKAKCDTPIIPKGHCCPMCGVMLTMDYGTGFKFNFLKDKIQENFIQNKDSVQIILSKSSNDRIQLVVLDKAKNGEGSKIAGQKIEKYIKKDINGPKKLGLIFLSVLSSGEPHGPTTGKIKSRPFFHNAGSVAGVIISLIVILLIIALVMYCLVDRKQCKRRLPLANPFRRFSDNGKGGDFEMDDSISYRDVILASGELNTFDNPMYNIPTTSAPSVQDLAKHIQAEALNNNDSPAILNASSVTFVKSSNGENVDGTTSFSNPLFGKPRKANTLSFVDPHLKLNPVYNDESVEDSKI